MREWLNRVLPDWASPALDWFSHPTVMLVAFVLSIALFAGSLLCIPWLVARLPEDYFADHEHEHSLIPNPRLRLVFHIGKNVLGVLLLLAGLAMLVLPGQGVLTLVVALVLLEFPGKRGLERRLVGRPRVLATLNALRRRAGKPPLVLD